MKKKKKKVFAKKKLQYMTGWLKVGGRGSQNILYTDTTSELRDVIGTYIKSHQLWHVCQVKP